MSQSDIRADVAAVSARIESVLEDRAARMGRATLEELQRLYTDGCASLLTLEAERLRRERDHEVEGTLASRAQSLQVRLARLREILDAETPGGGAHGSLVQPSWPQRTG